MCTNSEINLIFNAFRGVKSTIGDMNVLTSLSHYFLLDASYDCFRHNVMTLPLKHDAKRIAKKMSCAYDAFFTKFLAPFSLDQRIYLGDKSDSLREYIANDVERARLAMMDCCRDRDVDTQAEIANIWLCYRFAVDAQKLYQKVWMKSGFKFCGALYKKPDTDMDIDAIAKLSFDLDTILHGELDEDPAQKYIDKFQACVDALTRKICDWINRDYTSEIKSKTK